MVVVMIIITTIKAMTLTIKVDILPMMLMVIMTLIIRRATKGMTLTIRVGIKTLMAMGTTTMTDT